MKMEDYLRAISRWRVMSLSGKTIIQWCDTRDQARHAAKRFGVDRHGIVERNPEYDATVPRRDDAMPRQFYNPDNR